MRSRALEAKKEEGQGRTGGLAPLHDEGKQEGKEGRDGAGQRERDRNRARSLPSPGRTKLTVGRLCGRRSSNVDCDRGEDFFSANIEGALSEGPAQTRESKVST